MFAARRMFTLRSRWIFSTSLKDRVMTFSSLQVDVVLVPEQVILVLHPFEVRHRHAAGIAEDVRDQEHALLVEDAVRFRRHRAVGRLGDDPRVNRVRIGRGDGVLERRRDQDFALEGQQLLGGDRLRLGEAHHAAGPRP